MAATATGISVEGQQGRGSGALPTHVAEPEGVSGSTTYTAWMTATGGGSCPYGVSGGACMTVGEVGLDSGSSYGEGGSHTW